MRELVPGEEAGHDGAHIQTAPRYRVIAWLGGGEPLPQMRKEWPGFELPTAAETGIRR
jgi:hypothetical protein